ncbi:MAG: hypothetical protein ACLQIB_23640, partial [Isosphaeraceae bacterium]
LVGFNRTILEEALYRMRKIDMMLARAEEGDGPAAGRGRGADLAEGAGRDVDAQAVNGAAAGSEYLHEVS